MTRFGQLYRKLLRWKRNSVQREYEWQFSPRYWNWRQRWQRLRLYFATRLFGSKQWTNSQKENFSIFREIIALISKQVLLALVLVAVAESLEHLVFTSGLKLERGECSEVIAELAS